MTTGNCILQPREHHNTLQLPPKISSTAHGTSPLTRSLLPNILSYRTSPLTRTLLLHILSYRTLSPTIETIAIRRSRSHRSSTPQGSSTSFCQSVLPKYRLAAMMKADGENLVEMTNLTAGVDHAQSGVSCRRHRRRALHPILSTSKLTFF
jgi:hypothetical protein